MRQIYIVNALQVVTSEAHPEGLFSVMSGYPKNYDSRNYQNNESKALAAAKSEYFDRLSKIYVGSETRVMSTVTLETASGRQVMRESIGAFPVEPEPNEEPAE